MKYLELDEDGNYGKTVEGKWCLTPLGLARWMDEEGGLASLMQRNGIDTFIEAGCNPLICQVYIDATEAMEVELKRIGAVL